MSSKLRDLFKFWKITRNISEMVRDRDMVAMDRRLMGNRMWPIEWHKWQYHWPWVSVCCLKLLIPIPS